MSQLIEQNLNEIQMAGGIITAKPIVSTGSVDFSGTSSFKAPQPTLTIAALGTAQNTTPTAAQLLGGLVTQGSSGATGTVTLPLGTLLSAAITNTTVGASFKTIFANLGGGQNLTITGATGSTVVGGTNVGSAKNAELIFVNTGTNTWNVYTDLSA